MKQLGRSLYHVKVGETVTVTIVAFGIGNTAVFAVSPGRANQVSDHPRLYQFDVSVEPGQAHFGVVKCDFASDTAPDAHFQVLVSGLDDGENQVTFQGPHISKEDPAEAPISFQNPLAGGL